MLATINTVARLIGQYAPTCLAVLKLRKRTNLHANYRVPLGPVIPIFGTLVTLFLITQASTQQLIWGFGALIVGAMVYFVIEKAIKKEAK